MQENRKCGHALLLLIHMRFPLRKQQHASPSNIQLMPSRVTQKDIAVAAGVTQPAVSLALRNHASIGAETKERILDTAQKLGYLPDPYLTGLAAYRKQKLPVNFQATIAWISNWHKPVTRYWRGIFESYFQGANDRAQKLGYAIEEHALHSTGMTTERLKSILLARNIRGILLPPQPNPGTSIDFNFDDYSVVTFGYTLKHPELNVVTLNHYQAIRLLVQKLFEFGYKQPGLVLSNNEDLRTDRIWSIAFKGAHTHVGEPRMFPLLTGDKIVASGMLEWVRKSSLDVVISSNAEVYQWLIKSGLRIPEDIGFATLGATKERIHLSGIWQNSYEIGEKSIDTLVAMMHNNEKGIPQVRTSLFVDAAWNEGKTLPVQNT